MLGFFSFFKLLSDLVSFQSEGAFTWYKFYLNPLFDNNHESVKNCRLKTKIGFRFISRLENRNTRTERFYNLPGLRYRIGFNRMENRTVKTHHKGYSRYHLKIICFNRTDGHYTIAITILYAKIKSHNT